MKFLAHHLCSSWVLCANHFAATICGCGVWEHLHSIVMISYWQNVSYGSNCVVGSEVKVMHVAVKKIRNSAAKI